MIWSPMVLIYGHFNEWQFLQLKTMSWYSPVLQQFFPNQWAAWTMCITSYMIPTNLYSNISQILLLYKTWGYYNKFYSWWYIKLGGILLICQNTTTSVYGAWIKRCCILCSKTYCTMSNRVRYMLLGVSAMGAVYICETCLLKWGPAV